MTAPTRKHALPLVAALGALVLTSSGCAIDLSHLRPGGEETQAQDDTEDAAPLAEAALQDLSQWPAAQFEGRMAESGDAPPFDVSFTVANSGAAQGDVTLSETPAEVLQVDGMMFVTAGDDYWLEHSQTFNVDSDSYGDHWVRVDSSQFGMSFGETLAPPDLAEALQQLVPSSGQAEPDEVDGTEAYRVQLDGGEMWVSASEPHQVLRIQIAELGGEESGLRTDVTVQPLDEAGVTEFFDSVISTAGDLGGARDSRLTINWDGELDMQCATGGECTVTGTVVDTSGDAPDATIRVRMDATFSNDELGDLECNDSGSLDTGGEVELSCAVNYDLAPSANPQTYDVSGEAQLSTRSLGGGQVDDTVSSLEDQRDAAMEPEASPSEDEGGSGDDEGNGGDGDGE